MLRMDLHGLDEVMIRFPSSFDILVACIMTPASSVFWVLLANLAASTDCTPLITHKLF